MEAEVATIQSQCILSIGAVYGQWFVQGLTQVTAHNVFIAELSSKSSLTQQPLHIAIEINAKHIGAVVIEWHLRFAATKEFKPVMTAVPIDGWLEMKQAFRFCLYGSIEFQCMLELVIILGTIECVGTKVLIAETSMPRKSNIIIVVATLIE